MILVLGFANLFADGISMGASNYLARRWHENAAERAGRLEALRHASATLIAFVLAGVVPLIAYLAPFDSNGRFVAAVAMTAITLFAVGAARAFVTGLGAFRNGFEMLAVGSLAAVAAYAIGAFVGGLTN